MRCMSTQLELVRIAASKRRFLLSWRLAALYLVATIGCQLMVGSGGGPVIEGSGPIILVGAVLLWWFNRTKAVWIERDADGLRIRTRRWAKWEDLSSGRLRSTGTVTHEFPVDVAVAYDPDLIAWWRSDREITIDQIRFAVHPEARNLAEALVDQSRWIVAHTKVTADSLR